jgi:cyclopropane-fatty-acyl-phospholipid synthase
MILTSTDGQKNLPRYFATAFGVAQKGQNGRIDFAFDDGRIFRAEGPGAGPVCEVRIHDKGIFERLLREGQLGFCDAYLDGQWSTPDLQAFMDYIHADNEEVFDSFPGQKAGTDLREIPLLDAGEFQGASAQKHQLSL